MKKKSRSLAQKHLPILLTVITVSLLILSISFKQRGHTSEVLGEKTLLTEKSESDEIDESKEIKESEESESSKKLETQEEKEPKEAPEAPEEEESEEPSEEDEQEAEDVHDEVESEVRNGNVESIEVSSESSGLDGGNVIIERLNGSISEKTAPVSRTSLIDVQNANAGTISISIGANGTITLINNGITVQTTSPVIIDPETQSIAIRTPNGVVAINALPSQAIGGAQQNQIPTVIQSASLDVVNNQAYYELVGIQNRRFLGIVPVEANIRTTINAQNGNIDTVDQPWYLDYLGIFYTS